MRLLLAGCEYAGTTTLANAIDEWAQSEMGSGFRLIHDHFKLPDTQPHGPALTDEEIAQFQALSPRMVEVIQRHDLYYHTPAESGKSGNTLIIGLHFDEAVYGPLYYDYGHKGVMGDRQVIGRHLELRFMKHAPDTVLVHVKASPEVIRRRMKESPHKHPLVQEKDVEHVLERFEEEDFNPLLTGFALDTSTATVEESIAEFAESIQPRLTLEDRLAMWTHRQS